MGGKDSNFRVVYRGEKLEHFREGEWVFFQRPKECGGYWFGRTYALCFWLEFEQPTSWRRGSTTCSHWRASGRNWRYSTRTSLACRFNRYEKPATRTG